MPRIDELIEQARSIERELQAELDKTREGFRTALEDRRIRFSEDVAALQRPRVGSLRYVARASLFNWLAFPIIWVVLVPMVMLDAFLFVYQAVCFTAYGIPKVRRADYLLMDRVDLPYLNTIEKMNCAYCGYANGLAGYFTEIAARTEQFWCPIKHARRIVSMHRHYPGFFEFGDAEAYRRGLERLRDEIRNLPEQ